MVDDVAVYNKKMVAHRVQNEITKIFDQVTKDYLTIPYVCNTNGYTIMDKDGSFFDDEILGYFVGRGFGISNPNLNFNLLRLKFSDSHGFYLTADNYYNKLPILAIKHYLMFCRNWTENEFICCSADKGMAYAEDESFLQSCFIFACLDYYNKCLSMELSTSGHKRIVKNQLCFDGTTIANSKLCTLALNDDEQFLIGRFTKTLAEAKKVPEYNPAFSYGTYQIQNELNTFVYDDRGHKVYMHEELNTAIETLREKTYEYFDKYIKDKLLKYQLIK